MIVGWHEVHTEINGIWETTRYPIRRYYHPSSGYYLEVDYEWIGEGYEFISIL